MNRYLAVAALLAAFWLPGDGRGRSVEGVRAGGVDSAMRASSTPGAHTAAISLELETPAPEPTRGMQVGPNDRVQSLTYEQLTYVQTYFPDGPQWQIARVIWCESRFRDDVIGAHGERGRFQIMPFWMDDPEVITAIGKHLSADALASPHVSAVVATVIMRRYGLAPWSAHAGCPEWNR